MYIPNLPRYIPTQYVGSADDCDKRAAILSGTYRPCYQWQFAHESQWRCGDRRLQGHCTTGHERMCDHSSLAWFTRRVLSLAAIQHATCHAASQGSDRWVGENGGRGCARIRWHGCGDTGERLERQGRRGSRGRIVQGRPGQALVYMHTSGTIQYVVACTWEGTLLRVGGLRASENQNEQPSDARAVRPARSVPSIPHFAVMPTSQEPLCDESTWVALRRAGTGDVFATPWLRGIHHIGEGHVVMEPV